MFTLDTNPIRTLNELDQFYRCALVENTLPLLPQSQSYSTAIRGRLADVGYGFNKRKLRKKQIIALAIEIRLPSTEDGPLLCCRVNAVLRALIAHFGKANLIDASLDKTHQTVKAVVFPFDEESGSISATNMLRKLNLKKTISCALNAYIDIL